jgi:hypothetical protein
MGVTVLVFQIPCKSGWPSGVRGSDALVFAEELVAGTWLEPVAGNKATNTDPAKNGKVRCLI